MPDTYWSCSGQYSTHLYNNCVNCANERPCPLAYAKHLVPVLQIFPFGSCVNIIKELKPECTLSARTAGDPRSPNGAVICPAELSILNSESAFDTFFLSWSNNPAVSLLAKLGNAFTCILRGQC